MDDAEACGARHATPGAGGTKATPAAASQESMATQVSSGFCEINLRTASSTKRSVIASYVEPSGMAQGRFVLRREAWAPRFDPNYALYSQPELHCAQDRAARSFVPPDQLLPTRRPPPDR